MDVVVSGSIARSDSRVTSVDVARRAGVSQSTVSLVLSGKSAGRISARTEAAVREAAAELGYRPNVAARALRTGTARTVGLVVTDVTHPFFGPVLRGAQAAAWRAGYAVALVDVANDPDRERASFEALRAGPVDGFLFFTVDPPESTGEPVVAIEVSPPGMSFVRFDTEHGTELAMRHLLELGHTDRPPGARARRRDVPYRRDALLRGARRGGARAGGYGRPRSGSTRRGPRRSRCSTPPTVRPPSTATTTCSPAACTWRPASAACGSPATCRSWLRRPPSPTSSSRR